MTSTRGIRPGWSMLQALVVLALVGTGGAGAQEEGPAVASPGATLGPVLAAAAAVAAVAPETLLSALRSAEVSADVLPPGDRTVETYPWGTTDRSTEEEGGHLTLQGSFGAAIVAADDPIETTESPSIAYIVFPDEAKAKARMARVISFSDEDKAATDALGTPAAIWWASEQQRMCIVRVGYVVVYALSPPTENEAASEAMAIALAAKGTEHLRSVAEGVQTAP